MTCGMLKRRFVFFLAMFFVSLLFLLARAEPKAQDIEHAKVGIINDTPDFQLDLRIDEQGLCTLYSGKSTSLSVGEENTVGEHKLVAKAYVWSKYLGRRQIGKELTLKFEMTAQEKPSPVGNVGWFHIFTYQDFLPQLASVTMKRAKGADLTGCGVSRRWTLLQGADEKWARENIQQLVWAASEKYCVPAGLLTAVIEVESAFNPSAVSDKGALGLMQLMPATCERFSVRRPFLPEDNIEGGAKFLSYLLNEWSLQFPSHRRLELSLAAYHAGEGRVESCGGVPPFAETKDYIREVLRRYKAL